MSKSDDEIASLISGGQLAPARARIAYRHALAAERQAAALEAIAECLVRLADSPAATLGGGFVSRNHPGGMHD